MDKHEMAIAMYKAIQKRKAIRERKRNREADNATAELIRAKTRGKHTSICNSTRRESRY